MMINDVVIDERRRPVWEALSDLWRDSELQNYEIEYIAEVLIASGYSAKELHDIYAYEVAPAVWLNLFPFYPIIPPVWAGFDPHWLSEKIVRNIKRQRQSLLYRYYVRSRAGEWMRTCAVKEDWAKVLQTSQGKLAN